MTANAQTAIPLLAVALCLVGIGLWQRDLPWALRCTATLLPQVFFTHPRWALAARWGQHAPPHVAAFALSCRS